MGKFILLPFYLSSIFHILRFIWLWQRKFREKICGKKLNEENIIFNFIIAFKWM